MKQVEHYKGISDKIVFSIILIILVSIFIDTSIIKTSVYFGGLSGSLRDVVIYSIITLTYGIGQYFLLKFTVVRERSKSRLMVVTHKSVFIFQYVLLGLLIFSIIQMVFSSSYSSVILKVVTWINYSMSIIFLGLLSIRFISWFSIRPNRMLIAYAIAMLLLCLTSALAIFDIMYELYGQRGPEFIRPTKNSVASIFLANNPINFAYFITSVLTFIFTWFATVLLLQHYSAKIGRAKYWIIVTIPLVFFLSQFPAIFVDLLTGLRFSDPMLFGIAYTLLFSMAKPVGGILFGIAFWTVSKGLGHRQAKEYLIISGYGLLLLFTANQHQVLLLNPYPPFGLATISYVGLASYLVLVGIYSSALSVANDSELRRTIRRSIHENSNLLQKMGTAELDNRLQRVVIKKAHEMSEKMIEETGIESSLEEHEINNYVLEAIKEAKRAKGLSNT